MSDQLEKRASNFLGEDTVPITRRFFTPEAFDSALSTTSRYRRALRELKLAKELETAELASRDRQIKFNEQNNQARETAYTGESQDAEFALRDRRRDYNMQTLDLSMERMTRSQEDMAEADKLLFELDAAGVFDPGFQKVAERASTSTDPVVQQRLQTAVNRRADAVAFTDSVLTPAVEAGVSGNELESLQAQAQQAYLSGDRSLQLQAVTQARNAASLSILRNQASAVGVPDKDFADTVAAATSEDGSIDFGKVQNTLNLASADVASRTQAMDALQKEQMERSKVLQERVRRLPNSVSSKIYAARRSENPDTTQRLLSEALSSLVDTRVKYLAGSRGKVFRESALSGASSSEVLQAALEMDLDGFLLLYGPSKLRGPDEVVAPEAAAGDLNDVRSDSLRDTGSGQQRLTAAEEQFKKYVTNLYTDVRTAYEFSGQIAAETAESAPTGDSKAKDQPDAGSYIQSKTT